MSVLSWGGPSLFQTTPSVDGAPGANAVWQDLDTPKDGTLKINVTAGDEVKAIEEGGAVVDVRYGKNSYDLEFDVFVKKGSTPPFQDDDGVIPGEHAFRFLPEDDSCEGRQIDRSIVRVEESYTTADGILLHYVAKALRPKTGKTVKPYSKED